MPTMPRKLVDPDDEYTIEMADMGEVAKDRTDSTRSYSGSTVLHSHPPINYLCPDPIKPNVYRNGGHKSPIVMACYVFYIAWAFIDTMLSTTTIIKYQVMDPITKVWVSIGDPFALLLIDVTFITPDMISIFHLCLGVITFFLIISPNWNYRRIGCILYAIRSILDSTDGALARARAARDGVTLTHDSVIDFDFVCDTLSAILYGAAIVIYFIRNEDDLMAELRTSFAIKIFGACLLGVFLKGFILDELMEYYAAADIEPSFIAKFLWKISSYDSWDNLKLFALLSMSEYWFYSFSGYASFLWVGIPVAVSCFDLRSVLF